MSAIRLARAFTKRKYIVKFEGCYHGHADALLVKAGSGIATLGIPGSAGVPEEFTQFTLALPFNDTDALEQAFHEIRESDRVCDCGAGRRKRGTALPPAPVYLERSARITQLAMARLLIFDEVMTGFPAGFRRGAGTLRRYSPT